MNSLIIKYMAKLYMSKLPYHTTQEELNKTSTKITVFMDKIFEYLNLEDKDLAYTNIINYLCENISSSKDLQEFLKMEFEELTFPLSKNDLEKYKNFMDEFLDEIQLEARYFEK